MAETQQYDGLRDFAKTPQGLQKRWTAELKLAQKEFDKWSKRCDKIVKRYRDERGGPNDYPDSDSSGKMRKLNLLWSNVQTETPAIYQRPPQPQVARRFKDKDVAARTASTIIERYLDVDLERDRIDDTMPMVVQDRLLTSRGQVWVEYDPIIGKVPNPNPATQAQTPEYEQIVDVRAPIVYLYWDDFLHSPARIWQDVRWVARRHHYTRDECREKFAAGMKEFGWTPDQITLSKDATMDDELKDTAQDLFKRADVWEIWDAASQTIVYTVLDMSVPLERKKQPFALANKFPCPKPYYGTTTNGTLVPVPDFVEWQDLADEVDDLTERIALITTAVKVAGARSASEPALDRLLSESIENALVPVDNWSVFAEGGGLKGAISWLPMAEIMEVLAQLNEQRANRIDLIYQITGFGDLLRGQSDPNMTATAATIESNFGSLRIKQKQMSLARFTADALQIKAEIIAETAPPEVLIMVSGIDQTDDAANVGPAIELLKSSMRDFRVEVDEASMAAVDEAAEKQGRMEFLQAVGPYIQQVTQAVNEAPQLMDVAAQTLGFVARAFRAGRDLEGTLDRFTEASAVQAEDARKKAAEAAQQPPPPPPEVMLEQMKAQNATQLEQIRHQNKMVEIQADAAANSQREAEQAQSEMAIEASRAQSDQEEVAFKAETERRLMEFQAALDMKLAEMEGRLKLQIAERQADRQEEAAERESERETSEGEQ